MRRIQLAGLAALLGLSLTATLPLSSCSSGGDAASSGPMFIETCTLGCSNGQGGQQVSCTIVDVAQNVEVTVLFSQAVNLSTVNAASFRITNTLNGSAPVGTFALDPLDSRRLIFRPALTFDAVGNPIFALDSNQTYEIFVPGTAQGDSGSLIQSQAGKVNETRLRCTINTTQGLLDPVPGAPKASSSVVVTEKASGDVLEVFEPANGAVGVPVGGGVDGKDTRIVTVFDDIMNPATLANLATGLSNTVLVEIDVDGDPVSTNDRVPQAGLFQVEVDFNELRTFLTFTPIGGFPAGGSAELPRYIVLTLSIGSRDLVGNPLQNPGESLFQTQLIDFPELVLPAPDPNIPDDQAGEQFQDESTEDTERSGADWGGGRLTFGRGGGTGRAGSFTVRTGEVVELDTDLQTFPHSFDTENPPPGASPDLTSFVQVNDLLDNAVPGTQPLGPGEYDPNDRTTWPNLTVENGAFEFTRLFVQAGAILRLRGNNPARLFSRGEMTIDGILDIAGQSSPTHLSNTGNAAGGSGFQTALGGVGGASGPNGGAGGDGGDRYNHGMNTQAGCLEAPMLNAGGLSFPAPQPPNNPGVDNDGKPGGGVGQTLLAAGGGGPHWPPLAPRTLNPNQTMVCAGNPEWVIVTGPAGLECRVAMVGGSGAGGGYALDGGQGVSVSPQQGLTTVPGVRPLTPGPTSGGLASDLGIEPPGATPVVRTLDHAEGYLRGGAGGGGGGMSIYGTKTNTAPANMSANCTTAAGSIFPYWDHSAAGGGGGGGAIQLVSGTRLSVGFNGVVDAHGGDGGSSMSTSFPIINCQGSPASPNTSCTDLAQPGGGGAGGAVRLQSIVVDIAAISNKVIVAGGDGGIGSTGSMGGDGSPGLVRIEKSNPADIAIEAALYAPAIAPFLPSEPGFNDPFTSAAILSIGEWEFQRNRPDSLNASASCWIVPQGNFFELEFLDDQTLEENPTDDPAGKGWNMDILYATGASTVELFPYRGLPPGGGSPLGNVDFQEFLGNLINSDLPPGEGSLISVRFQGARSAGDITDPCDVTLSGFDSQIQPDSLTRWVMHPADLNLFFPRPNMIRFCVVFEEALKAQGPMHLRIQGVTNLRINVQPN